MKKWKIVTTRGRLRVGNNRGLILPLALMAFLVLGVLATALLSVGSSEVQIASNHLRNTQADFLAEAGLEHAFSRIWSLWNTSRLILTTAANLQDLVSNPSFPSVGAGSYTVQYQSEGLWTWKVVSTGTTIVGSQQFPQIRRAVMTTVFQGRNAILANGPLTISGTAEVTSTDGNCGHVHANGNLTLDGQAVHIYGDATASGEGDWGTAQVDGIKAEHTPTRAVAVIDPVGLLNDLKTNSDVRGGLSLDHLYQMKGNGEVLNGNGAPVLNGNGDPITLASGDSYCGWRYTPGTPLANWEVRAGTGTPCDGTFYFEGNATVTSSPGSSDTPWKTTLIATGDVVISGQPAISADANYTVYDTLFYAGGDISIGGNPNNTYNGLIAAHEQFSLNGTATFTGFIIGQNAATNSTTVNGNNNVSGHISLTYDCGSRPRIQGPLTILSWGL